MRLGARMAIYRDDQFTRLGSSGDVLVCTTGVATLSW